MSDYSVNMLGSNQNVASSYGPPSLAEERSCGSTAMLTVRSESLGSAIRSNNMKPKEAFDLYDTLKEGENPAPKRRAYL